MENHPGPLVLKQSHSDSSERIIINKLQNCKLSVYDNKEFWSIRANTTKLLNKSNFDDKGLFFNFTLHTEDELYVKGNTAVWHKGSQLKCSEPTSTSYSSDNTIKYAFFCILNRINYHENDGTVFSGDETVSETSCICLVGTLKFTWYE